jgi:hypothetical protein
MIATDGKPTIDDIDGEIRAGLRHERPRLRQASENWRTYLGHFDDDSAERSGRVFARSDSWDADAPDRGPTRYDRMDFALTMPVMQRIVNVLCGNLYKKNPTRELATPEATKWLEGVYRRNKIAGKWPMADRMTASGGFAAYQCAGDSDPAAPVKVQLWGPDQVAVWVNPDDPERPLGVATLDKYNRQTRLTLWTEEEIRSYTSKRTVTEEWTGGQSFDFVSKKPNPYRMPKAADDQGRGILPFSFAHFYEPIGDFCYDGPGDWLNELNQYINFGCDDLADGVRYLSKPIGLAEGVSETWDPPVVMKPGMFLHLPASGVDAGNNGPVPTLRFVSPELQFVQTVWSHLNSHLDTALEMIGIPPSTIRLMLEARSGIAVLSERAPLLEFAEQRRRPFAGYEHDLARLTLLIGAAHRTNHGRDARMLQEVAIASDIGLVLGWPRLYVDLPGPERDRADSARVATGQASLIDILQEREDCTREQALARLKRVKSDNDELQALGIEPNPSWTPPTQPGGGMGAGMGGFGGGGNDPSMNNLDSVGGGGDQPDQAAGAALEQGDRFGGTN